jgi:hypothetical protein
MRMNADFARCGPSLSVDIPIAEGDVGPHPARHQRPQLLSTSKAQRDGTSDLVAATGRPAKKSTSAFVASGPGYQLLSSQGCAFSGADAEHANALTAELHGVAIGDCVAPDGNIFAYVD